MRMMLVAVGFSILGAVGCATGYGKDGFSGGYSDSKLSRDRFQVTFQGNGYTSVSTVKTYLLFRCAELTVENGFDYFVILDGERGGSFSAIGNGVFEHPQLSVEIKCGNGPKPEQYLQAYDAHELLTNLEEEVLGKKRGTTEKKS